MDGQFVLLSLVTLLRNPDLFTMELDKQAQWLTQQSLISDLVALAVTGARRVHCVVFEEMVIGTIIAAQLVIGLELAQQSLLSARLHFNIDYMTMYNYFSFF